MKIDLEALSFDPSIDAIRAELPLYLQSPRVGIICGSGLSSIGTTFHKVVKIPYTKIPGFSKSTG
jgi:purine-nucleoside phosphorylase